jgi:hypothetical protein
LAGLAHGITLAWEFSRVARKAPQPGIATDAAMSAIRGLGFGLGAAYIFGGKFGVFFGVLSAVGQSLAYRVGIRPGIDYRSGMRPQVSGKQLLAALNRTVGYTATGYLSSLAAQGSQHAAAVGLRMGLSVGLVTALGGAVSPLIEWTADNVPERRMGAYGIGLILVGFALQSVQYWLAALDVTVR